jgi:hypothetical protein
VDDLLAQLQQRWRGFRAGPIIGLVAAVVVLIVRVNRTKVHKVSQDFSIVSYINKLGGWQLLGLVMFPSIFGGHIFFATHGQI